MESNTGAIKFDSKSKEGSFSRLGVATKKAIFSFAILVLLFAFFSILRPDTFPQPGNLVNLAQQVVTYAIVAVE